MAGRVKNKSIFIALFFLVLLSSLSCYAGAKAGEKGGASLGKEILVAKDFGGGDEVYYSRWCGNNALIYKRINAGVEWVDIHTRERIKINIHDYDDPLNCTPDSQKLLFYNEESRRKDKRIENPVELAPGVVSWLGNTRGIYTYELRTGKSTLVGTTRGGGEYDALSPDGTKVLLGRKHKLTFKKGVSEWEGVWFSEKWNSDNAKWFPDSSGVVTYGQQYDNAICVEKFGENGWAKCFKLETGVDTFKAGRDNRIYYLARIGNIWDLYHLYLYQCEMENGNLKCKRILKGFDDIYKSFDFLPNGDIIFQDSERDECIWRATPGKSKARCVLRSEFEGAQYENISLTGVSPDGRWLAFERYNRGKQKINSDDHHFILDLFVIELTNN